MGESGAQRRARRAVPPWSARPSPSLCWLVAGYLCFPLVVGAQTPQDRCVLVSAQASSDPPQLRLSWPADPNATAYEIERTLFGTGSWRLIESLGGDATSFTDMEVRVGARYEYKILKRAPRYTGYGYLAAGIEAPLIDQRGKLLLLVANTHAAALAPELAQLQQDLIGDGWTVIRHDVSSATPVADVKARIVNEYQADPSQVQAVFLFGQIPVPYSGEIAPDGHDNHRGAWPADVYYGDMQGLWTDHSVTNTLAEKSRNWNVPGDGKFDQNRPPGGVVLQVGRVDLSNLTCFSNKTPPRSELDLLRQYLVKNHRFRHAQLPVVRRALICDNFQDKGADPIGASGWRNFSAFFGADNIDVVGWSNYFPAVTRQWYLWTFASGGGQYYTCTGVGSSDDFALQDVRAVFTMWLGSYFGDWDNESNLLRAALGSSTGTLTSSYSGFPQWLYHPMAMGETIGYCARLTQNNQARGRYPPFNPGSGQVHIALHGDPSLRLHPVAPPSRLTAVLGRGGVRVDWEPSPDREVLGYHIYRASSPQGPFQRLTRAPLGETWFIDSVPDALYMVRAVKLERSAGGTYFNLSQGVFAHAPGALPDSQPTLSIQRSGAAVRVILTGAAGQTVTVETSQDLRRWESQRAETLSGETVEFSDAANASQRFYRSR